jgi:glycosyltransferase involved in cell wall biosynthesis
MRLALIYTTFPKRPETFLQREAVALIGQGVDVEFFSIFGGRVSHFHGKPVHRLGIAGVLRAILKIPVLIFTKPSIFKLFIPPQKTTFINYCENLLGMAAGAVWAEKFKKYDWVHAQWGAAPAMAAYAAKRFNGLRYSMGLHAYDLFEGGGDGWLKLKVPAAEFVASSNAQAREEAKRRFNPKTGYLIRRGLPLNAMPTIGEKRFTPPLKIISFGRLLPKKGLHHFIEIMAELEKSQIDFDAEIIGNGPLAKKLQRQIEKLKLSRRVKLTGWLENSIILQKARAANLFLFTGCVAKNGDRDGFPNVIAEAFACGCAVIARDAGGVAEGVIDGQTGILMKTTDAGVWRETIEALMKDPPRMEKLRRGAELWVRENFDAVKNAMKLMEIIEAAARH